MQIGPTIYTVLVGYAPDYATYFVISSSIIGLNVETSSLEELIAITEDVAPSLLPRPNEDKF